MGPETMRSSKQHRVTLSGFSLVEMLVVMLIMGIVGAIALPRYSQFQSQQKVEAAARRITSDLAYASRRANSTSTTQTVTFNIASHKYTLVQAKNPNKPNETYVVKLGLEPYNARIVSAAFGGDTSIVFNGYGRPDSGGSVTIAVGSRQKTITIGGDGGKVEIN